MSPGELKQLMSRIEIRRTLTTQAFDEIAKAFAEDGAVAALEPSSNYAEAFRLSESEQSEAA